MEFLEKWIYECLGVLMKEPTEETKKIVAKTIASEIEDREKGTKIENRIIELEKQIADLKDYILKVSKFLHNNNNTKPDKLAYKERDMLLIKELKLFEKWELENDKEKENS